MTNDEMNVMARSAVIEAAGEVIEPQAKSFVIQGD